MKLARSMKRKSQLLNRKEAKKTVKRVETLVNNTEKSCHSCAAKFDPQVNKEQLDSWRVRVYESHAELYCDVCSASEQPASTGESARSAPEESRVD